MKTNITPELKQSIADSIERSKIAVAKLEEYIKDEPTTGFLISTLQKLKQANKE